MNVQEWMPLIIWFIYLVIFAAVVTGIIVFIKLLKSKSSSAHPVRGSRNKKGNRLTPVCLLQALWRK